jgi:hypothetical protein
MPVEFLSDEQVAAYGTFTEVPSSADLEKFFFLDAFDRDVIAQSRADSHRLGVAVQVCTVRYMGLFLEDRLGRVPVQARMDRPGAPRGGPPG